MRVAFAHSLRAEPLRSAFAHSLRATLLRLERKTLHSSSPGKPKRKLGAIALPEK